MATEKFKDPSPYTQPKQVAPEEDYLYAQYERDVTQRRRTPAKAPTGVAIFGLGRAGSIHLSNLARNPRARLLYVVDEVVEKWDRLREYWSLEGATFLTSQQAAKVYEDPKVEAVIVCSPTHTHEAIVTASLAARKAVFCEKPVAEDVEASRRCYERAALVARPLFCAFNRRFDAAYAGVRERVRAGAVGHAHVVKVCSRDSPLPTVDYLARSGGVFHDCVVHDIDMACWLVGELPRTVRAAALANVPEIAAIDDFDTVAVVMTFASGTIALLDNSRHSGYGYDQRVEVFGPRGMIRADNERPAHGMEVQLGQEGSRRAPIWFSFPSRYRLAYEREMEHFLDVVDGLSEPMVKDYETLAVSKIATAAEKSARTGQTVTLEWTDAEMKAMAS